VKIDALLGMLRSGKIPVAVVLAGDERWFADQAVRLVKDAFLPEDGETVILEAPKSITDPEGTSLAAATDEVLTVPMFGGRKLILYRMGKFGVDEAKLVAGVASAAPDFARLVVQASAVTAAVAKHLTAAGVPLGECRKLFDTPWPGKPEWDTALNKWVTARARERGRRLDLRTAHVLTGVLGNDLGGLESALEKLCLASGDRAEIVEEDVRALTGGSREFDAFAFGEAVYGRNSAAAFRVSRNAFIEGVEMPDGRRVRVEDVVAGRLIWSKGIGVRNRAAALRAVKQAGTFDLPALRRHHALLARAEAEVRTTVPGQVVVETLIPKLTEGVDD